MVLLHLYLDHLNVNKMNEWMNNLKIIYIECIQVWL
jgi:hypothetical protein